jgi:hypothetical protein
LAKKKAERQADRFCEAIKELTAYRQSRTYAAAWIMVYISRSISASTTTKPRRRYRPPVIGSSARQPAAQRHPDLRLGVTRDDPPNRSAQGRGRGFQRRGGVALVGEMITKFWSRSLCALFAMIGASTSAWAQDAKVITYDEWSAIESAKGTCERVLTWHKEKKGLIAQLGCDSIPSCNEMMPTVMACTMTDPAKGAKQFENKIVSEFFTNPSCRGLLGPGIKVQRMLLRYQSMRQC